MNKSWRRTPEKHLFHDFMQVIERVARTITDRCMTNWSDENFIQVFMSEMIKSCTASSQSATEAIVWVTQPSRKNRFLGICRSLTYPSIRINYSTGFCFQEKPTDSTIDWFLSGKRVRGNVRRRRSPTATVCDGSGQANPLLWSGQLAVLNNLDNLQRNGPSTPVMASLVGRNAFPTTTINNLEPGDDFPSNDNDDDAIESNVERDSEQRIINQTGRTNSTSSGIVRSLARQLTTVDRTLANPQNSSNLSTQRAAPNLVATLVNLPPLELAGEGQKNRTVKEERTLWNNRKIAPSWCMYFRAGAKSNHFAIMMHPSNLVDRYGKKRTALDVFIVHIILSKIFEITYNNMCLINLQELNQKVSDIIEQSIASHLLQLREMQWCL